MCGSPRVATSVTICYPEGHKAQDFLMIRSCGLGELFTQPVGKKGSIEQGYADNG